MSDRKEEELKACPFCGGEARLNDRPYYIVRCDFPDCTAELAALFDTKEEAITAWNTRTPDTAQLLKDQGEMETMLHRLTIPATWPRHGLAVDDALALLARLNPTKEGQQDA